jgi:hypothetical protein
MTWEGEEKRRRTTEEEAMGLKEMKETTEKERHESDK